jgi:beta-lactamase class A
MRRLLTFLTFALIALAYPSMPVAARRHTTPSPSPSPTASPIPTPAPLDEAARFGRLRRDLVSISASAPGRLGIAVVDVKQYTRFGARADEAFPLASIVKVPIALVAYRRSDQHTFDLDRRVEIGALDLRRGGGPIASAHPHGGASYTNVDLLRAMLIESDNTASDALLRELGGPKVVDAFLTKAGVNGFDIRKSEADLRADFVAHRTFARGGDNSATPNAVANLLFGIATQAFARLDSTNELLQQLSEVHTGERRLRAGFPGNAEFAHKTGTSGTFGGMTDATNDAGILTLADGRRVIVVALLAESHADLETREATLASVARAVYRAYEP